MYGSASIQKKGDCTSVRIGRTNLPVLFGCNTCVANGNVYSAFKIISDTEFLRLDKLLLYC